MNLITVNHHRPVAAYHGPVFDSFSDLIDRMFPLEPEVSSTEGPASNILEKEEGYLIEMAVPGYDKKNIRIELESNRLRVIGEGAESDNPNENYTRREFSLSSFQRSFVLPKTADTEKIEAGFRDGILRLQIPKRKEAIPAPPRRIDIR